MYQKFLDNSITREEFDILLDLVKKMGDKDERSRLTYEIWKIERARSGAQKSSLPKRRGKTSGQLTDEPARDKQTYVFTGNRRNYLWKKAVVFLLIVVATFLVYHFQHPGWWRGGNVTLLEKVTLSGQKATILLADGSTVHLNSASKLVFPEKFGPRTRKLTLEGEAFFEVSQQAQKPFTVFSGKLKTTVLGTSFNIKAYPEDQKIDVAVAEGRVAVSGTQDSETSQHILTTNTLAIYHPVDDEIKIDSANVEGLIAWKEGVVKFDGTRFDEVARTLEKWYGVKFIIGNERIGNCVLFGEFENASLNSVLKLIQVAINIEYEFTAKTVKISGHGCDPAKDKF